MGRLTGRTTEQQYGRAEGTTAKKEGRETGWKKWWKKGGKKGWTDTQGTATVDKSSLRFLLSLEMTETEQRRYKDYCKVSLSQEMTERTETVPKDLCKVSTVSGKNRGQTVYTDLCIVPPVSGMETDWTEQVHRSVQGFYRLQKTEGDSIHRSLHCSSCLRNGERLNRDSRQICARLLRSLERTK